MAWIKHYASNSHKMISTSRTSDFQISGSAISSHKNIHGMKDSGAKKKQPYAENRIMRRPFLFQIIAT